jgi:hypothetical protein
VSGRTSRRAAGGGSRTGSRGSRSVQRRDTPSSSGGLLGRVFGPPVLPGMSEMPTFRRSVAQGFALAASSPVLLVGCFVFVFGVWLALLAFGYVGDPLALTQAFALPPLSTAFDTQNAVSVAGQRVGLTAAFGLLVVRALVVALAAAAIVDGFEHRGRVGRDAIARGLMAFPRVLAATALSFVALFIAQLGVAFGTGLAMLGQLVVPALALYLLGFVPFVAVRGRISLPETLRQSVAAARTPGGRHLTFCLVYVLIAFVLPLFVPNGSFITANPALSTWIGVLVVTLVHLVLTAAFAYRWLAVEATIQPVADAR